MALGAARDPELTYDTYEITGCELRAIGINTDYAPDADVNVNPANPVIGVRSFSSDPELVAENVSAAVSGLQDQRVTATAKHFPGHGDTGTDSHYALPLIDHTRAEWEKIDHHQHNPDHHQHDRPDERPAARDQGCRAGAGDQGRSDQGIGQTESANQLGKNRPDWMRVI
jgi:hypothetical protein